jgi:hypothetical protein
MPETLQGEQHFPFPNKAPVVLLDNERAKEETIMSKIQLHSPTSSELAGRRRWPLTVPALFTLSFLLVIYYLGATVVIGLRYFYQWNPFTADVAYTLSVWSVYLSVPLAAILAGAGAAIAAHMLRGRLWLMIGVLVVALVAPIIVDVFVPWTGSWPPVVFGGGGVLIITSVLLTCWFWAEERAKPRPASRRNADLRLLAYVLFGMAAYWT